MSCTNRILSAFAAGSLVVAVASSAQAGRTSAAAATGLPEISVTVKAPTPTSRLVHIANRDNVPGFFFLIRAVDSPKFLSATTPSGACTLSISPFFIVTTKHTEYRAHCRFRLAPGHAVDIRMKTRGAGTVAVFACPPKPSTGPCRF